MVDYRNDRDSITTGEIREDYEHNNMSCGCECCHCKKIFMMLVLLILAFIAGIMVGNCSSCRYADAYYGPMNYAKHDMMKHPKKFHRGMQQINPNMPARQMNRPYATPQAGGFVMEVDEID